MNGNEIVKIAKTFIGKKEIKGNQGYEDPRFTVLMENVGWQVGHAWCSYFAELVVKLAYKGNDKAQGIYNKLCSAGAVRTLENFTKAGYKVSAKATPGAIVIWQNRRKGAKTWTGHAGIVTKVYNEYFETIEGNTGNGGAGVREGEIVATRKRNYNFNVYNGLELQGFIWPLKDEGQDEVAEALPFKNKTEGNKFRRWVNDNHKDVAQEIDLDRAGSYKNSYILKAYERLKELYTVK